MRHATNRGFKSRCLAVASSDFPKYFQRIIGPRDLLQAATRRRLTGGNSNKRILSRQIGATGFEPTPRLLIPRVRQ
jgi:hypothetical protein